MITSKNLSHLEPSELRQFLDSFDNVLCDCDGVLFIAFAPIPGATDGLEALRQLGKKVRFVSNNCTHSLENFCNILSKTGVNSRKEDVIIPTTAIISYLKNIEFKQKLFVIGFTAFRQEFVDAGFELSNYGPDYVEEKAETIIAELKDDPDVGAVIVDLDVNLNYIKLQKALIYIRRPEVLFITAGYDMRVPLTKDTVLMGSGYFQNALCDMTGRKPFKFGKPGKNLHCYVLDRYKLKPERTLFIGDTFSDCEFAADNGYQMLAVLSGVVKEKDLESCKDEWLMPKFYVNNLHELHKLISNLA